MLSDINTKFELNECPFSTLFSKKTPNTQDSISSACQNTLRFG